MNDLGGNSIMPMSKTTEKKQIPIREGLFTTPLTPSDGVRLIGSRCGNCSEVSLGKRPACPNCGGEDIEGIVLCERGQLWTYTIIRHRPPGDFKGPDPFLPFGLGLVELPDGIRVVSPIDCDIEKLKIGMELELVVFKHYEDEKENEVMAFKFKPV